MVKYLQKNAKNKRIKKKIEFILESEKNSYKKFILHGTETETTFFMELHEHRITPKLSNKY